MYVADRVRDALPTQIANQIPGLQRRNSQLRMTYLCYICYSKKPVEEVCDRLVDLLCSEILCIFILFLNFIIFRDSDSPIAGTSFVESVFRDLWKTKLSHIPCCYCYFISQSDSLLFCTSNILRLSFTTDHEWPSAYELFLSR